MKKLTAEWVGKAEDDLAYARMGRRAKAPLHDGVCFHCQQAAEKYLKALLHELGLPIPYTHDLVDLLNILLPHDSGLKKLHRGLRFLTPFAVDYRYPGIHATARESQAALRWAQRVRQEIRPRLGLPMRRPRRRKPP